MEECSSILIYDTVQYVGLCSCEVRYVSYCLLGYIIRGHEFTIGICCNRSFLYCYCVLYVGILWHIPTSGIATVSNLPSCVHSLKYFSYYHRVYVGMAPTCPSSLTNETTQISRTEQLYISLAIIFCLVAYSYHPSCSGFWHYHSYIFSILAKMFFSL